MVRERNRPEIRKKSGMRNGFEKSTIQRIQPVGADGVLVVVNRVEHHHQQDADALGVIDPADAVGQRRAGGQVGEGVGCIVLVQS